MSDSFNKGRNFERKVASILRSKLGAKVARDRRSGAGVNKSDISDYYQEIPLHLELKDQETIKVKEWFRQTDAAASFNQVPTLVFHADEEILSVLRFSDLVNFLVEIADQKAEIDDMRAPRTFDVVKDDGSIAGTVQSSPLRPQTVGDAINGRVAAIKAGRTVPAVNDVAKPLYCREGHIADQWGYCMQLSCKYSRSYRKPKAKKRT